MYIKTTIFFVVSLANSNHSNLGVYIENKKIYHFNKDTLMADFYESPFDQKKLFFPPFTALHYRYKGRGQGYEKKICSGIRRDEGIKWFKELSDKGN